MEQRQKKKLLRLFLSFILVLTMIFTLAACPKDNDSGTDTDEKRTNLVTNGDFKDTTGSYAPYSPSSWSYQFGSGIDSSNAEGKYVDGVINTDSSVFEKDQNVWNPKSSGYPRTPNPGSNRATSQSGSTDTNVLMINNRIQLARGHYNSFSTEANAYYKLSVDVRRQSGTKAYVDLRNFSSPDFRFNLEDNSIAVDRWETFTFWIEGSHVSKSVTIELWNGLNSTKTSSGAVFFDNVYAEKIDRNDYEKAEKDTSLANNYNRFITLRLPNTNFDSFSGTSFPASPNDYSTVAGTSLDPSKTSASGGSNISYGIVLSTHIYDVDVKNLDSTFSTVSRADGPGETGVDGYVLMLQNKNYTSYGYQTSSSNTVRLTRGKFYEITVSVKTDGLLSSVYTADAKGNYYKKSDGSYTKITSDFISGTDELAIRTYARVSQSSSSSNLEYLTVIDLDGNLYSENEFLELFATGRGGITDSSKDDYGPYAYFTDKDAFLAAFEAYIARPASKPSDSEDWREGGAEWAALNSNQQTSILKWNDWLNAYNDFLAKPDSTILYNKRSYNSTSYRWTDSSATHNRYSIEETELKANGNANNLGGRIALTAGGITMEIKGIVTDGEWLDYTFFIQANQYDNIDLTLLFALGEGGLADTGTHVKGYMFVDTLRLEEITFNDNTDEYVSGTNKLGGNSEFLNPNKNEFKDAKAAPNEKNERKFVSYAGDANYKSSVIANLYSDEDKNLIDLSDVTGEEPEASSTYINKGSLEVDHAFLNAADSSTDFGNDRFPANPGLPYEMISETGNDITTILGVTSLSPAIYNVSFIYDYSLLEYQSRTSNNSEGSYAVLPYSYYKLSMWIKTLNIPEDCTASVAVALVGYSEVADHKGSYVMIDGKPYLLKPGEKYTDISNRDDDKTYTRNVLSQVTGLKTSDDDLENENNGWKAVTFYVAGNRNTMPSFFDVEISFGSGTYDTPETLAQGQMFVAYPSFYKISYKEYNDSSTSGGNTQKYSFSANTFVPGDTITNGSFDEIDTDTSEFNNSDSNDVNLLTKPGTPSSWTYQEGKLYIDSNRDEPLTKEQFIAGIIDPENWLLIRYLIENGVIECGIAPNELDSKGDDEVIQAAMRTIYDDKYHPGTSMADINGGSYAAPEMSNSMLLMTSAYKEGDNYVLNDFVNYGYRSSSKYLSSNKYYRISVMAKVLWNPDDDLEAYIYLTSSSSPFKLLYGGVTDPAFDEKGDKASYEAVFKITGTEWTEYVFYVAVGQSSVSVNLEFWFGTKDKKSHARGSVIFDNVIATELSDKTEGTTEYKDYFFFDSMTDYLEAKQKNELTTSADIYNTVARFEFDLKKYGIDAAGDSSYLKFEAMTYVTDSFDAHGSNIYSSDNENLKDEEKDKSKYLYNPVDWTGDQNKKPDDYYTNNRKSITGVVDISDPGIDYVFNADYDPEEDENPLGQRVKAAFYNPSFGNSFLMIYNPYDDLSYKYTSSSKYLNSNTIYAISLYVKTMDIANSKSATVTVQVSSGDDNKFSFNINTATRGNLRDIVGNQNYSDNNDYTKITVYANNTTSSGISNVTVSLALGDEDNGLMGFAAIDEITIERAQNADGTTMTSDDFDALLAKYIAECGNGSQTAEKQTNRFDTVGFRKILSTDEIDVEPGNTEEDPKTSFQWLIITSGVVGGLIVLIVLVFLYQRYNKRAYVFLDKKVFKGGLSRAKTKAASSKKHATLSPTISETKKEYDSFADIDE